MSLIMKYLAIEYNSVLNRLYPTSLYPSYVLNFLCYSIIRKYDSTFMNSQLPEDNKKFRLEFQLKFYTIKIRRRSSHASIKFNYKKIKVCFK